MTEKQGRERERETRLCVINQYWKENRRKDSGEGWRGRKKENWGCGTHHVKLGEDLHDLIGGQFASDNNVPAQLIKPPPIPVSWNYAKVC